MFRVKHNVTRKTKDPGPNNRHLTETANPIIGVYGYSEKLALFGIVPRLDKEMDVDAGGARTTRGGEGLGDVKLLARYTTYQDDRRGETRRLAPFIGVKLPTGEDDKKDNLGRLLQTLQLGSGSTDFILGNIYTRQKTQQQIDASVTYTFKQEANDFEFGDELNVDASYQYRLYPKELGGTGVPSFLYGVLGSNWILEDQNINGGVVDPDSGGTTWYLTPGLQYVTKDYVLEAAVQLPVKQNLHGNSLETDQIVHTSFRMNF